MKFFLWGFLGTLGFFILAVLLVVIFKKRTANTNSTQSAPAQKSSQRTAVFGWFNWENLLGWATTIFIFGLIFLVGLGVYHLIFGLKHKPASQNQTSNNSGENIEEVIKHTSEKYKVDPRVIKAVIQVESGFKPEVVSPKGAMGLMQLMPETAKNYGIKKPFDPKENIEGGVHLLSDLLKKYNGNLELALAAYNSGENTVDSLLENSEEKNFSKISSSLPQETRNYVPAVIAVLEGRQSITPTMYTLPTAAGVMPAPPEILAKPGEWSPFYSARPGTRLRPKGKVRIQSRTGLTLDVDEDLKKPSRSLDDTVFRVMSGEEREVTLLVLEK